MEVGSSRKPANLEFVALAATALIWLGAFFLGVGLVLAYIDLKTQLEIQAVLASSSPSEPVVLAVTMEPTATSLPPTPTLPPPTITPSPTPTTSPTATSLHWTPTPTLTRAEPTVYAVQGGDSLWKIAESYGITVDALVEANGISKDDVIRPGQELFIPVPGQALPTPLPRASTPAPTSLPAAPTDVPTASVPAPTSPAPSTRPPPATAPPDRIVASTIGLDAPVVPVGWKTMEENGQTVTEWEVADYAGGWHKTSAYPGNVGNTVISGHHNIRGEVFRYVVNLEPGHIIDLYVGQTVYRYMVTEKYILREKGMPPEVRQENARWIAPTEDERLTLVTCWPYTNNTHRVVVVAKPG
ncbi:MAG: sortase [Anaerolineales bacterium]|nr:MAG: sortase [Anaerolineales bacterium]